MTQTVTITRAGTGTDAEGRPTTESTSVEAVGLVTDMSAAEQPQGGALGQETTAQAVLPFGTDVQARDQLSLTYPASGLAVSYRVVAVHDATRSLLVDLRRDG